MTDTLPSDTLPGDTTSGDTGREPRPEKVAVVDEVKARLSSSSAALLTEYRGLKVAELAALRTTLSAAGADLKIYKNTLVRFAVRDLELDLDEAMLTGPTAIAFVDGDAAAVAKALRDYARTNPLLVVKGGVLGRSGLSADEARALADLPSREVLLARLAGGLAAPLVGFAGLLQALPRNLAYGLKALIDQGGAPGAPAGDPAPAADAAVADTVAAAEAPEADAADAAPAGDAGASDAAPAGDAGAGTIDAAPQAEADPEPAAAAVTEAAAATDTTEAAAAAEATTDAAPAAEATQAAPAAEGQTENGLTTETPEEAN